nr:hypothetical protein [Tanacetum cinerariifolium]
RRCRPGRYPIRAFPFDFSRATCRPGKSSPATSRPGFPGIVAGENGKCFSDNRLNAKAKRSMEIDADAIDEDNENAPEGIDDVSVSE